MKAVVMAGGEGTRLRPLTSNQPKPMVPIVGKPCMEHIVELLHTHGFEDVIVTVAFMPQAIRSYFGDGSNLGLQIEYSVWSATIGCTACARRRVDALASDRPRYRTLPASTSSAMAPTVSSIGVPGSTRC